MNFDWLGYLTLAKEMMNKVDELPDREAVYRSVVSRAYYAVFCLTRNYVRDIDKTQFHGNDHQKIQNYLTGHPHKTRKKLGNQLRTLHQHRIKADYDDNLNEQAVHKANKAIQLAEKIVNGLAEVFS